MAPIRHASPAQRRHSASVRRDVALDRLSTITGSIAVASLAAVGVLGLYVAKALPGHHATPSTGATSATVPGGNAATGGGTSSSANTLNPPSTPPTAASAPPAVTSGST